MQFSTSSITLAASASTSMASVSNSTTPSVNDKSTTTLVDLIIVTEVTTYYPEPTELVTNGKTYTVTEAITLIITKFPCNIKKPAKSSAITTTVDEITTQFTTFCPEYTAVVTKSSNETTSVRSAKFSTSVNQTTTLSLSLSVKLTETSSKASAPVIQQNQNVGNAFVPSLYGFASIVARLLL